MVDHYSARISQTMADLTPTERKVARRLIASGGTLALQSSTALAGKVGVSGPTVSRFVKKLGFADYAAFQAFVRAEIDDRMRSPIEMFEHGVESGAGSDADMDRFERNRASAVHATFADLPKHELQAACELLATVRRPIGVIGGWTTAALARHLASQLQQVRPLVFHVGESQSDLASFTTDANSQAVGLLFDFRRYEQRTIDLARALRRRGSKVVLITDVWLSPAADDADVVLPVVVETSGGPFDTLAPAMVLLEAIVDLTVREIGKPALDRYRAYNDSSLDQIPRWMTGESSERHNDI